MRRLFHHYDSLPDATTDAPFLIARVLEDGDSEDVAELFATLAAQRIRSWLAARGGRQLSRRSRALWSRLLGVEPAPGHPLGPDLWPL
jgi:hypothetical protein